MSLVTNTTIISTWKLLKIQYITLAGGIALAGSAAIGFGTWEGSNNPTAPARSNAAPASPVHHTEALKMTVYIVGSQEQANLVRESEVEAGIARFADNVADPPLESLILIADSSEAEARIYNLIASFQADAAIFETFVVEPFDLRGQ